MELPLSLHTHSSPEIDNAFHGQGGKFLMFTEMPQDFRQPELLYFLHKPSSPVVIHLCQQQVELAP